MISPQPNKYAEIILPRYPIQRSTNFIIEEESWSVVEYDYTSVPGVIYLSLTENKVNLIYDDLENNIADIDKLAKYAIETSDTIQRFNIGDTIEPKFTLMKNGVPIDLPIQLITTDKNVVRLVDGELKAINIGTVDIIIQFVDYPEITKNITIEVTNEEKTFAAYIDGKDFIRLDREEIYQLKGNEDIGDVIFSLDETQLAKIIIINSNSCKILANAKNKLGQITLRAQYNGNEYVKNISIIPLW